MDMMVATFTRDFDLDALKEDLSWLKKEFDGSVERKRLIEFLEGIIREVN